MPVIKIVGPRRAGRGSYRYCDRGANPAIVTSFYYVNQDMQDSGLFLIRKKP